MAENICLAVLTIVLEDERVQSKFLDNENIDTTKLKTLLSRSTNKMKANSDEVENKPDTSEEIAIR